MIFGVFNRFVIRQSDRFRAILLLIGFIVMGLSFVSAQSSSLTISSGFSSSDTVIGREVKYFITIRKADTSIDMRLESPDRPVLPKSSALTFGRFQTSEQYQSSEGSDPVGITLEFEVVANVEGRVIMPSFAMKYMGRAFLVPVAILEVRSPEFDLTGDEIEWMILEIGETPQKLKVGQRVKTNLNLYVLNGLRNVTYTNPIPVGSDFSMDRIAPGPTERLVTKGRYRYRIYSWPLTFTAVRSGLISVGFKISVNFRIPNDRLEFIRAIRSNIVNRDSRIDDLLQDSREESVTMFSSNLNRRVEPLPIPDNPGSFYHAIGQFDVLISIENERMQVGQPTNLSIVVKGEGNFGAFREPNLQLDNLWRIFSPHESFDDQDFLGFKAEQVYKYVIIPLSSDISEIPPIPYTFFDIGKDDFVTIYSKAILVKLQGDSIIQAEDRVKVEDEIEQVDETEQSLTFSIYWNMGLQSELEAPFFLKRSFYLVQIIFLGLFLLISGWRLRGLKLEKNPGFARQQQIDLWVHKYLKLASIAAKEEDSEQFYESAFLAFCAVVAAKNDYNVEAITVEDVLFRVRDLDLNDNIKRVVESYLYRYEHHRFSGGVQEDPPLANEYDRLKSILKKVENRLNIKGGGK